MNRIETAFECTPSDAKPLKIPLIKEVLVELEQ